jgi:hypothetical protein
VQKDEWRTLALLVVGDAKALDLDLIHGCPLILAAKAPDRTLLTSSTAHHDDPHRLRLVGLQ